MSSQYPHSNLTSQTTQKRSTMTSPPRKRRKKKTLLYRYRRLIYLGASCFLLLCILLILFKPAPSFNSSDLQTLCFNSLELGKLSIDKVTKQLTDSSLEDPSVQKLITLSEDFPLSKGILLQLDHYPYELIELAAKKTETIDFVAHYPEYVNASSHPDISIEEDYVPGSIPFFLQWDKRWGYEQYGNTFIAINGCGPTCLSMVAVGLTGDTSLNPKQVADFSYESGYLTSEAGTSWTLMTEGALSLGLEGEMIPADPQLLRSLLQNGTPIIASMCPGHFTTEGHFIVLYGIDHDDAVSVHDPDSMIRSQKTWPLSLILEECKCLWQFKRGCRTK